MNFSKSTLTILTLVFGFFLVLVKGQQQPGPGGPEVQGDQGGLGQGLASSSSAAALASSTPQSNTPQHDDLEVRYNEVKKKIPQPYLECDDKVKAIEADALLGLRKHNHNKAKKAIEQLESLKVDEKINPCVNQKNKGGTGSVGGSTTPTPSPSGGNSSSSSTTPAPQNSGGMCTLVPSSSSWTWGLIVLLVPVLTGSSR